MEFMNIREELNIEESKKMLDAILSAGDKIALVVDRSSFDVLYASATAKDVLDIKAGDKCYDILACKDTPCIDCPHMYLTKDTIRQDRFISGKGCMGRWEYTSIEWFDHKDAVLVELVELLSNDVIESGLISRKISSKNDLDSLTGLPMMKSFSANLSNAIRYNEENDYAVVVFDVYNFKSINDRLGIVQGDEILKKIANLISETFELENNCARFYSDIFAFYMPYKKRGEIVRTIEKIRNNIQKLGDGYDIPTNYGIYLVDKENLIDTNLMCDRARMAAEKSKGDVNLFCSFYDEQYRKDMLKNNEIEQEMEAALESGEFKMYLQPKVNLSDGELCGAEVLSRWEHPSKGMIPPMDFIPLFEKNGFILKLDEYMWEQACKTIRGWLDEGKHPVPLSVNISRYHIQHGHLMEVFTKLLETYKLTSDMLTLELTESMFEGDTDRLNDMLAELRNFGFKIEIDDFGSGLSSLNLIRRVPVDTIKIDKAFLDQEMTNDRGKIVVSHTISMAKDLNMKVVAEGVETAEHVEFLKKSHCDVAQGYYFAKPMKISEFNEKGYSLK